MQLLELTVTSVYSIVLTKCQYGYLVLDVSFLRQRYTTSDICS